MKLNCPIGHALEKTFVSDLTAEYRSDNTVRNAQKMMKREQLSMSDNKVKWITQVSDKTFFTVFKILH